MIYLKVILAGIFWAVVYLVVLVAVAYAIVDMITAISTVIWVHNK